MPRTHNYRVTCEPYCHPMLSAWCTSTDIYYCMLGGGGRAAAILMLKILDTYTQDLVTVTRCHEFVHSYSTQRKKQSWTPQHIYLSSRPGLLFNALSNKPYTLCSISIYMKTKIILPLIMQYENITSTHHRTMNMYLGQLFYFNHKNDKSQLKG